MDAMQAMMQIISRFFSNSSWEEVVAPTLKRCLFQQVFRSAPGEFTISGSFSCAVKLAENVRTFSVLQLQSLCRLTCAIDCRGANTRQEDRQFEMRSFCPIWHYLPVVLFWPLITEMLFGEGSKGAGVFLEHEAGSLWPFLTIFAQHVLLWIQIAYQVTKNESNELVPVKVRQAALVGLATKWVFFHLFGENSFRIATTYTAHNEIGQLKLPGIINPDVMDILALLVSEFKSKNLSHLI